LLAWPCATDTSPSLRRSQAQPFWAGGRIHGQARLYGQRHNRRRNLAGELGLAEALDAVGRALTRHAAGGLEVVQVRQRLTDREAELVRIELAAEEHRNQRGRGARLAERVERLREALVVMRAE